MQTWRASAASCMLKCASFLPSMKTEALPKGRHTCGTSRRGSAGRLLILRHMPACCHAMPEVPLGPGRLRSKVRARLGGLLYSGDEGTNEG